MGRRANLQKSDGGRINCVPPPVGGGAIYALGIGSDLASPAPGGTGASLTGPPASPAPGGTGWRPSRGQLRRIRHPHGSDSASEPTPPKGGSDDPLRGSFARTRRDPWGSRLPPREGGRDPHGSLRPREGRSGPVRDATFALKRPSRVSARIFVGSLGESELGRTRPAPGGTGPPASPAPGGTGWRPSRGVSLTGWRPSRVRLCERTYPPYIYIYRGGATIPYIYKGIVRSHPTLHNTTPQNQPKLIYPFCIYEKIKKKKKGK